MKNRTNQKVRLKQPTRHLEPRQLGSVRRIWHLARPLGVHPTKYILYVNSAKYKIFKNHKKYLEVLQSLKPKEKILIDIYILLFSALFIINSPGFQRVTLVPMRTTLFSSGNCHTEKQPFWKKALRLKSN